MAKDSNRGTVSLSADQKKRPEERSKVSNGCCSNCSISDDLNSYQFVELLWVAQLEAWGRTAPEFRSMQKNWEG
jgi:hypothetical protein